MDLDKVQLTIGYKFKDLRLLRLALTHRSYLNEREKDKDITEHNERLEFLGDAVLELVVTEYLYANFQDPEGYLTALRASLVNYRIIGDIGNGLGLDEEILLSSGEKAELGKARLTIVADAVEAVIGAMYLDGGYQVCLEFIKKFILIKLTEVITTQSWKDSKTLLQEFCQKYYKVTPHYRVLGSEGKDHEKTFRVGVTIESNRILAEGEGRSKQDAETAAAEKAMEVLLARQQQEKQQEAGN